VAAVASIVTDEVAFPGGESGSDEAVAAGAEKAIHDVATAAARRTGRSERQTERVVSIQNASPRIGPK
jgi:hypothetical protein